MVEVFALFVKLPLIVPALLRVLELPSRVKFPAMVPKLFTLPFFALKVIPLVAVNVLFCATSKALVILPFPL